MLKNTIFELKEEKTKELFNKAILEFNEMRNTTDVTLKEALELN